MKSTGTYVEKERTINVYGSYDVVDADELSDEEIKTRLAVYEDPERKKKERPGELDGAWVLDTGTLIGIRQTRFFEGEYKITNAKNPGGTKLRNRAGQEKGPASPIAPGVYFCPSKARWASSRTWSIAAW